MSTPRPNEYNHLRDRALSPEQRAKMRTLRQNLGMHVSAPSDALAAMRKMHESAIERTKDDDLIKAREEVIAKMTREEKMNLAIFGWKEGEAVPFRGPGKVFPESTTAQNPFNKTNEEN